MRVSYFFMGCGVLFLGLSGAALKEKYPIEFFSAMSYSKQFNETNARGDLTWQFIAKLYNQGMAAEYSLEGEPLIPKKFHLIWLGSTPPERYKILSERLLELHPGYSVKLWIDEDAHNYQMINRVAFNHATNWGEKSDILRYEILYNEGGVYLDGDFEVLQSFEHLFYTAQFFAGLAYDPRMILYNGLIGSVPQHDILKLCILELGKGGHKEDPESIMQRTGPYHFTRCFVKGAEISPARVIPFPVAFFYPWPNYALQDGSSPHSWQQEYSIAMHLWAQSWVRRIN